MIREMSKTVSDVNRLVMRGYMMMRIVLMQAVKLVARLSHHTNIREVCSVTMAAMGQYGTVEYIPTSPAMNIAFISS
jgi:hypothetical protein